VIWKELSQRLPRKINPREVIQLKNALTAIVPIKELCKNSSEPALVKIAEQLNPCSTIREKIEHTLVADPPVQIGKGSVIAAGVSVELDDLRKILYSGKDYLLNLQQREIERTGIPSLKVNFNNVFGYYIEVRNTIKIKFLQNGSENKLW